MAEVIVGFYEPKEFTAGETLVAGDIVHVTADNTVSKTSAITDVPAGVVLVGAASGAKVTVVHGCWLKTTGLTAGPLEPSTSGGLQAETTGRPCGYAKNATEAFIY